MRSRRTFDWMTSTPHFFAHHAAVAHALVLAAVALVVLRRAEDLRAEEPVPLRLEGAVVDGLGFFTSPCDHERILSGEASEMRMALKLSGFFGFLEEAE